MLTTARDTDVIPLGVGCYTAPEAARLLKTSARNIIRWLGGYSYKVAAGQVHASPLWRPQLPRLGDTLEIGFRDLIELRFVLAFLRHGVGINVVRRCLANARKFVKDERPFSTHRFRTDGKSIFLESLRESDLAGAVGRPTALTDLKNNQMVFKQVVEQTFKDLDFDEGTVRQWRPFKGKPSIVLDPERSFGKPLAAGYGVPTAALARAARAENSARRAAFFFDVSLSVVNDAISFERSLTAA